MPTKETVQLLRNVSIHGPHEDAKMAGLMQATRDLSMKVFDEDCLVEITKKSGWKLSLLVSDDLSTLCGFIVSKVAKGALSIAKLAVPSEFRGSGFGRLIMDEVMKTAKKQSDVYEVCLLTGHGREVLPAFGVQGVQEPEDRKRFGRVRRGTGLHGEETAAASQVISVPRQGLSARSHAAAALPHNQIACRGSSPR
jgi:GNAT superfamily N-acetyltransferase